MVPCFFFEERRFVEVRPPQDEAAHHVGIGDGSEVDIRDNTAVAGDTPHPVLAVPTAKLPGYEVLEAFPCFDGVRVTGHEDRTGGAGEDLDEVAKRGGVSRATLFRRHSLNPSTAFPVVW